MLDTPISSREREALEYLKGALPAADRVSLNEGELLSCVRRALKTRDDTPWGGSVPVGVFYAFALFPRVNNENLVFCQEALYNAIIPRLAGKSMTEAALEVNYWCLEHATYQSTDERTASPATVINRACGRCGEESVLLVSALRSVGIPARIVYVPRWSHCDDNHAWTEVWLDGVWRYMGSCEPEPVADSGWFTSAASKAMLVHTKAYGLNPQHERVESRTGGAFVINRTAAYAKTRLLTVRVVENGRPRKGLSVRFEIINMAELYPINEKKTDEKGIAALVTGLGSLWLHISDGEKYVCRAVDASKEDEVTVDFANSALFEREARAIRQFAPQETRIQPVVFAPEIIREHARRIAACVSKRAAYEATFAPGADFEAKAKGNHATIKAFLSDARYELDDKRALLGSLKEKDLADVTADVLNDAISTALPFKNRYPREIWVNCTLCPRVKNEFLEPVREKLRGITGPYRDAREVWADIEARIELCDMSPETIYPKFIPILEAGRAGAFFRDALFVAAARSHGFAARLNPVSGEKEYFAEGRFCPIQKRFEKDARIRLANLSGQKLLYGEHFTLGVLQGGVYKTLRLDGLELESEKEIEAYSGRYRALICARQIDGSIDAATVPFEAVRGETARVEITLPATREKELMTRVKLDPVSVKRGEISASLPADTLSSKAIYAFIAPGQEPSEHFLNELIDAKKAIAEGKIEVRLIIDTDESRGNKKLQIALSEIPSCEVMTNPDMAGVITWRKSLRAGDMRPPFALAVDEGGFALFAFVNYHVGSVRSLLRILDACGQTE